MMVIPIRHCTRSIVNSTVMAGPLRCTSFTGVFYPKLQSLNRSFAALLFSLSLLTDLAS